ncbi:rod shape-determining protein MreC [Nocardioides sp.]|uniref:rod shape-determining protein MreC n=1 Tax=Nocardioides sp. TaxID=35761 RepID=UPI00351602C9
MAIDTRPVRPPAPAPRTRSESVLRAPGGPRRRPARRPVDDDRGRPSTSLVAALVLACGALMALDHAGAASPIEPVRTVVGDVLGPVEAAASRVTGPVAGLPGALRTNGDLRERVDALEQQNTDLRTRLDKAGYDRRRLADLAGLRRLAGDLGYALLPTRVIAVGGSRGFSSTITIDAGSDAGLHPDMTVVAPAGLVGRITSVTRQTATVLLLVDAESAVGGRVADDSELGFVTGRGDLGAGERLQMQLVDASVVPKVGQEVVTWGSEGGAPYVSGVPIGRVTKVYESVRETSYRAVIEPAVDLSRLDLVSVVVPSGTAGRVIEADGSLR